MYKRLNISDSIGPIFQVESSPSTNLELAEIIRAKSSEEDIPDWTTLWALEQTDGRGKGERAWFSKAGKSLTFSTLIRIQDTPEARERIGDLMLIGASAAQNALITSSILSSKKDITPNITVKPPNDLYIDGKKIAGILGEFVSEHNGMLECVIGVGLNTRLSKSEIPFDTATSLEVAGFELAKDFDIKFIVNYLSVLKESV